MLQSRNTIFEVKEMPQNSQTDSKKLQDEKLIEQIPITTGGLNQSGRVENQNQGHNTKKQSLGPNTKR